ncbi:MAG: N-acetylneuraminate synthase/pseudaminic acid synthase [Magnetococcales bacterium]|nr:N-acetylneuraminate synthase/pseudaminic acid synthase [Magnetococcales bacterium]
MFFISSPVLSDWSSTVPLGNHVIGPGHSCFVIAEAGSNHGRNLNTALALVDAAADAGCDAVKFQTFTGEDLAANFENPATRLPEEFRVWGNTLQELYKNCSLPDNFHEALAQHAKQRGILFLSSPFSEVAVDRLVALGVAALKIASFELGHLPLIRHAASTNLPLILSTGMAGLGDIERALNAAAQGGAKNVILLHCGSNYPMGPAGANLASMETMRRAFGTPVGFSDHTLGIAVPIAAATLGANVLEKHFTLDRNSDGPDHPFALEPDELKEMVTQMHTAELAVGGSRKRRQPEEEEHARRGRRSLFYARPIKAGEIVTLGDFKVLRPGIGLEPVFLELLLHRQIHRSVEMENPVVWEDFLIGE